MSTAYARQSPNVLCPHLPLFSHKHSIYSSPTPHISVCSSVYLHLCCHYLLTAAIICPEQGALSALMCICPHCVLNLNLHCPNSALLYPVLYPFYFIASTLHILQCTLLITPYFCWVKVRLHFSTSCIV